MIMNIQGASPDMTTNTFVKRTEKNCNLPYFESFSNTSVKDFFNLRMFPVGSAKYTLMPLVF